MSLIPEIALADLRALNEASLNHRATITIERAGGPRVGGALVDSTPETLYVDVPCRLSVMTSRGASGGNAEAGQQTTRGRWILILAEGSLEIPEQAIAQVTGNHVDGTPWTRSVRVVGNEQTRGVTCMAKYLATDLGPAGAPVGR